MHTVTLPRLSFDKAVSDARIQLAEEAASKLGYKRLANAITIPGALLYKLRELSIEPLDTASVQNYKAKKEKPGMWAHRKFSLQMFGLGLACAFISRVFWPNSWDFFSWHAFTTVLLMIAQLPLYLSAVISANEGSRFTQRVNKSWQRHSVDAYTEAIPEHVLSKAVEIASAVPGARFYIDSLQIERERRVMRDPDPFLLVQLGNESYYIDVWDERDYRSL